MAVNATAIWRVRPSGSNTNGGGFDPAISGVGTDYSGQNAAQASGTHGTTTGTTTFTDLTALAFTSAMVGNAIYITGTGQTTGWYFVTAYSSSSVVTLDRSPGTGTLATWYLGGGWADLTNLASTGPLVSNNTMYVLGSGTPNPASYTYDYTYAGSGISPAAITINLLNDPSTPGYKAAPDTTGGMPVIKFTGASVLSLTANTALNVQGIWFVSGTGASAGSYVIAASGTASGAAFGSLFGCVTDQFGLDTGMGKMVINSGAIQSYINAVGCEIFSSQGGTGGVNAAFYVTATFWSDAAFSIVGCNIHDCVGYGIYITCGSNFCVTSLTVINSIIAKCSASGIYYDTYSPLVLMNCTIDGNGGDGLTVGTAIINSLYVAIVINNIFSNHTGAGKYGAKNAANLTNGNVVDYNTYYNNTTDTSLGYGPHDTHGGSNPYVNQATENYALA